MKLTLKEKFWIGTFITLWLIVSTVSTIHSVEFFKLTNNAILSWSLALAFEIGAIASLGGLLISRGSKGLIWMLFIILTAFQIHCNMYWCWINIDDISEWSKLLDLVDEDENTRNRIFCIISGGILPLLSLGFMKSLMDYLKPQNLEDVDESVELVDDTKEVDNTSDDIEVGESSDDSDEDIIEKDKTFWKEMDTEKTIDNISENESKLNE